MVINKLKLLINSNSRKYCKQSKNKMKYFYITFNNKNVENYIGSKKLNMYKLT